MTLDLEAIVDERSQDLPWRVPASIASTGDASLDAALAHMESAPPDFAAALAAIDASRHPDVAGALLDAMEKATQDFELPQWSIPKGDLLPEDIRPYAFALHGRVLARWTRRQATLACMTVALEGRHDEALSRRMLERVERGVAPAMLRALLDSLLGWRFQLPNFPPMYRPLKKPGAAAGAEVLAALAAHLAPDDSLLPWAAEAVVELDPEAGRETIERFFASLPDDRRPDAIATVGCRFVELLDLDRDPRWVDVLSPMLRGQPLVRLALLSPLGVVRTSAPLLAALRNAGDEGAFSDLLARLRSIDDSAAAGPLQALAATLPDAPPKAKLARSRGAVLALAKRLTRTRTVVDRASFEETAAVGTDGGPIVVLRGSVREAWRGAPADYGSPGCAADNDYDRACAATGEGGVGFVEVAGTVALVLPEQHAGFAPLANGQALLVIAGTPLTIEMVLRERHRSRKLRRRLEVDESGLVLLDAAYTSSSAPDGAVASVTVPPGVYALEEVATELPAGAVHFLRLVPK